MISFSCFSGSAISLSLWLSCFDDSSEGELAAFLSLLPDDTRVLQARVDERAVCQGVLLPLSLAGRRGYYLYALATHPEFRGRGYMKELLRTAREMAVAEGLDFLALIPATPALAEAYRRAGFVEELPLAADPMGKNPIYRLPPEEELVPFDGDFRKLLARYDGELSPPLLRLSLASFAGAKIFYTEHGFCVLLDGDRDKCLTADRKTLANCKACPSPYRALLCPISALFPTSEMADPLPR